MDRDRQRTDPYAQSPRQSQYPAPSSESYRTSYAPANSRGRQSQPAGYPSPLPQSDPYRVVKKTAAQTGATPYGQGEFSAYPGAFFGFRILRVGRKDARLFRLPIFITYLLLYSLLERHGSSKLPYDDDEDFIDQKSEYSSKGIVAGDSRASDGSTYIRSGSYGRGSEDYGEHDDGYGHPTNKRITANSDGYYYSGEYHKGRTNSYLPYSHHTREPYKPPTSQAIYDYSEDLPNYSNPAGGGNGGHLHDGKSLDDPHGDIPMDNIPGADSESTHYRDLESNPKSTYWNPTATPTPDLPTIPRKRTRRCCCGVKRRTCVFIAFGTCVVIGIIAYFCWPRIPIPTIGGASLVDGTSFGTSTAPVIKADWLVNVSLDSRDNYIPIRFSTISIIISHSLNYNVIGKGSLSGAVLNPRGIQTIQLPIAIDYETQSNTDATWRHLYDACGPQKAGASVALQISFTITFEVWGLSWTNWKPSVVATAGGSGLKCPGT
ncbi:hypothetical protein BC936DRAFT_141484 [Jimgerdemannia flammicorona]|uniref:Uncharacterized protein n=2 Tax=Jimgerdemannia flammicorona TaxID=994334 RepID=A0A433A258_9FUNG|nr:hypothetical protein BC936DRAFT_141484 [Jimgerdemannia flammicorona]RUS32494.1 hypothetical protein BC938DRAFT_475249 [Jimgerdemannia flammicorona]